jgi:N-carbamoylputrescine amidase
MTHPLLVTVCELNDDPALFAGEWDRLVEHVKKTGSQMVLLPEMPFDAWFATTRQFDPPVWEKVVSAHERWLRRLKELAPAVVVATRPINSGQKRINEGFVWDLTNDYRSAHQKYYLPDEEGFWEAKWYQRSEGEFKPIECGTVKLGFLICTEMWFMQHARAYGKVGIHLLVSPRASGYHTVDKWVAGGRAAAVIAGAFSLSSNHYDPQKDLGGGGWVIGPEGQVLGLTSQKEPFISVEIDLDEAEAAKLTYPRYVME